MPSFSSWRNKPVTQIFIIGGSHAGLNLAKLLLNANLPHTKITLINTSSDYYFNLASPRLLARPFDIALGQLLIPIEKLFAKHPEARFEFVHASVTRLDPKEKIIFTDDGALRNYHHLVIASGSKSCFLVDQVSVSWEGSDEIS